MKQGDNRIVGLIGCGAIGSLIAHAAEQGIVKCDKLILYDCEPEKAAALKKSLQFPSAIASSVDEMLKLQPTVIVEAASQQAVKEYMHQIVNSGVDLIVMSTGALIDMQIPSSKVHVPSGAIGGLDAISSAALAGIDEVILTTRKNPAALGRSIMRTEIVYDGNAEEAVQRFPREMNVAATLALMVKPAKVKVRVIADPEVRRNTHEIQVKWQFGEMTLRFANDPHPENPHTSALAAWSAIRLLQTLLDR
ncbi:MAG: aspartate dehydrogenase [Candidatus Bathyarchaeia archaeon]